MSTELELSKLFLSILESHQKHPFVELLDLVHEARISFYFEISGIQEGFRFRSLNRARRLSQALIDERGEIKKALLQKIIILFEQEGFIFYPTGRNDGLLCETTLDVLRFFCTEEAAIALRKFQIPLCHPWAEKLVCKTLGISVSHPMTSAKIRAAILCACLTPLRQNVGSCFATAPAILIQKQQLPLFLEDLYQLLTTGKLKRTFGGIEYSVPLSPSTGMGDLKKKIFPNEKMKVEYSPGIIAALEAAGKVSSKWNWEEKVQVSALIIQKKSQEKTSLTVEELIRALLLEEFSLTEKEVQQARKLEIARFKGLKMGFEKFGAKDSQNLERIFAFQEKEKQCRASFKAVCDNALLKSWEFTLASFSEVKMEFSRWNLYSSLGFAPEEKGGIGEIIYRRIEEKIEDINKLLEKSQKDYEIAFDELRATESLLRRASSSDAYRLQAEYQSRSYHLRACLEKRDALYARGSQYSKLFSFLLKQYDEKFPEYFQEIYDAEMQDFQGDLYDDSPAGFRLVYKHGRPDPSLWTLIYDSDQYIESLLDFFSTVEPQIASQCDWEGGDQDILEISALLIAHIRTPLFLETALQRMAKAHSSSSTKTALKNRSFLEKKPWAYTSGGTLNTLIKTYYCREKELFHEEKWVESPSELLIFIIDVLKNLPPRTTDLFLKNPKRGMLMTSPSHVFILMPGQEGLCNAWQEDLFTYTWVRDFLILPSQKFYSEIKLDLESQQYLLTKLCENLPLLLSQYLQKAFDAAEKKISPMQWRNRLLNLASKNTKAQNSKEKQAFADTLDSFLYQSLPLVSGKECNNKVHQILSPLMNSALDQVLKQMPEAGAPLMTAQEVCQIAQTCYLLATKQPSFSFDLHHFVASRARSMGLAQPAPFLFADTNWSGNYFAFVVNPGNEHLELWRMDSTLSAGVPMSEWKQWLNGSDRKSWTIFTHPHEYEMGPAASLALRA